MATRAVYEFYDNNKVRILSVYIHWDGYPDGAAMYFKKALDNTPNYLEASDEFDYEIYGNKFMTNFIRVNESAEITLGSERHGDLEYLYKVNIFSRQITMLKYMNEVIEKYTIEDFLKKYNKLI